MLMQNVSGAVGEAAGPGSTPGSSLNPEPLLKALHCTQQLRTSLNSLFEQLSGGVKYSEKEASSDGEKSFLSDIKDELAYVNLNSEELDKISQSLPSQYAPLSIGNPSYLSLDPITDRTPVYTQITQTYKWLNKVHSQSLLVNQMLLNSASKKSTYLTNPLGKRSRRNMTGGVFSNQQQQENFIQSSTRLFQDINVSLSKPYGSLNVVVVNVGRVMKVTMVIRAVVIEWVECRAFQEDTHVESDRFDPWMESQYAVFKKISQYSRSFLMHNSASQLQETNMIRAYLAWLHSYRTLFTQPCVRCKKILNNYSPPTFREFRFYEAYHDECRR